MNTQNFNLILIFSSGFIVGIIIGIIIMWIINAKNKEIAKKMAQAIYDETQNQKEKEVELILTKMRETFGNISFEALSKNSQEFIKYANEVLQRYNQAGKQELDNKKQLIDQTLGVMKDELTKVENLIKQIETERATQFGNLSSQLKFAADETFKLRQITDKLQVALANTKARGNWGERMAEDVLRLSGFMEGINYFKQKAISEGKTRPDFTFLLPKNLKLNMDVKFPFDNYLKYLEALESEKEYYKNSFLTDVRNKVKDLQTRNYINPEDNTVDYVLMFIPNEQVYSFINEMDRSIIDEALKSKVIICSPITLYAILAIIRQAVENFNLEKTAASILTLLAAFKKRWDAYQEVVDKMGKKLNEALDQYNDMVNSKKRNLDKELNKIDELVHEEQVKGFPQIEDLTGEEKN